MKPNQLKKKITFSQILKSKLNTISQNSQKIMKLLKNHLSQIQKIKKPAKEKEKKKQTLFIKQF